MVLGGESSRSSRREFRDSGEQLAFTAGMKRSQEVQVGNPTLSQKARERLVLPRRPSAIDENRIPSNKRRCAGGKEYDCTCDIHGLTNAVQRSNTLNDL